MCFARLNGLGPFLGLAYAELKVNFVELKVGLRRAKVNFVEGCAVMGFLTYFSHSIH